MSLYVEGKLRGASRFQGQNPQVLRHQGRHRLRQTKAPVAGAFRAPFIPSEIEIKVPRGRLAGTSAPLGDGLAYERGEPLGEADLGALHEEMTWFPPSPYMVSVLRSLIRKLQEVGGIDSTLFLRHLGANEFGDFRDIESMSGLGVAEILGLARRSVDKEILIECGWDDAELTL
jgi:hypothetical protein